MLSFLVLCSLFKLLRGANVSPPHHPAGSMATTDVFGLVARDCPGSPDDSGQQLRSVYSIVNSCLLTVFACVWTSIHPNINGPRDSDWTCLKRKVVTALCALIAPELVLLWALRQRTAAKSIAERYNKNFAKFGRLSKILLCGFKRLISCGRAAGDLLLGNDCGSVSETPQSHYTAWRWHTVDYNAWLFCRDGWLHPI